MVGGLLEKHHQKYSNRFHDSRRQTERQWLEKVEIFKCEKTLQVVRVRPVTLFHTARVVEHRLN